MRYYAVRDYDDPNVCVTNKKPFFHVEKKMYWIEKLGNRFWD